MNTLITETEKTLFKSFLEGIHALFTDGSAAYSENSMAVNLAKKTFKALGIDFTDKEVFAFLRRFNPDTFEINLDGLILGQNGVNSETIFEYAAICAAVKIETFISSILKEMNIIFEGGKTGRKIEMIKWLRERSRTMTLKQREEIAIEVNNLKYERIQGSGSDWLTLWTAKMFIERFSDN